MASLNNNLSTIYNNLYTFFKYRKLIPLNEKLDDDEFIKYIYNNEYFIIDTISENVIESSKKSRDDTISEIKDNLHNAKYTNKENYKITYVILFHYSTDINAKTPEFKKIISLIDKNSLIYDIILITKISLSTHVKNYIKTINNKIFPSVENTNTKCKLNHNVNLCNCFKLNIFMYVYDLFVIIIPNHILSNKHKILPAKDVDHLLNNVLFCKKNNLPKIKINDPQIIWSSGKVGDVVCITRNNDISGLSLYYRVITN